MNDGDQRVQDTVDNADQMKTLMVLFGDLVSEVARVAEALEEIAGLLDPVIGDDSSSFTNRRFIRTLDIGRE